MGVVDLELLWSHRRLDRERATRAAVKAAVEADAGGKAAALGELADALARSTEGDDDVPWERRHGGLLLAAACSPKGLLDAATVAGAADGATAALAHSEPRVREQAGVTLGALANVGDADIYAAHCSGAILAGIKENLERADDVVAPDLKDKLKRQLQPTKPLGVDEILHQSAGWKTLETSCKALLEVAKSMGERFAPHVTPELLGLITRTLSHTNRFVRETGFQICAELSTLVHGAAAGNPDIDRHSFDATMSALVSTGLADNWSQLPPPSTGTPCGWQHRSLPASS